MELAIERTLTHLDFARLTRLVSQAGGKTAPEALQDLLEFSDVVESPAVAPDIVTMYSQVLLDDGAGGAPYKLTLCYPADAEPARGFVSVLSPVGTALLGLKVGQLARWSNPGGGADGQARIREILFQPEATGDYTT